MVFRLCAMDGSLCMCWWQWERSWEFYSAWHEKFTAQILQFKMSRQAIALAGRSKSVSHNNVGGANAISMNKHDTPGTCEHDGDRRRAARRTEEEREIGNQHHALSPSYLLSSSTTPKGACNRVITSYLQPRPCWTITCPFESQSLCTTCPLASRKQLQNYHTHDARQHLNSLTMHFVVMENRNAIMRISRNPQTQVRSTTVTR